jgi:hypothetical protein
MSAQKSSIWTKVRKTLGHDNKNEGLFEKIAEKDEYDILVRKDKKGKYYSLTDLINDRCVDYYIISGREKNEFKKENASKLDLFIQSKIEYYFKKPLAKDENLKKVVLKEIKDKFDKDDYEGYPSVLICQQPLIGRQCRNDTNTFKFGNETMDYCHKFNRGRLTICLHTDIKIYENDSIVYAAYVPQETGGGGAKKKDFEYEEAQFPDISDKKAKPQPSQLSWIDKIKKSQEEDAKFKAEQAAKAEAAEAAKAVAEAEAAKESIEEEKKEDDGWIEPPKPTVTITKNEGERLVVHDLVVNDNNSMINYRLDMIEKQMTSITNYIANQESNKKEIQHQMEMITTFMKMFNKVKGGLMQSM